MKRILTKAMTAQEFTSKWIKEHGLPIETSTSLLEKTIAKIVQEYHEQQAKNCLIADVVVSLPSDEDIQREAYIRVECWDKVNDGDEVDGGYDGFIKGCKWIIGKLRQ